MICFNVAMYSASPIKAMFHGMFIEALARAGAHLRVVASVAALIEIAVIEPMQRNIKHSTSTKKKAICYYIRH